MEYWLWLRQLKGIGTIIEKRLLEYFGCPKAIYEAEIDELMAVEGIGTALAKSIKSSRSLEKACTALEVIDKKNMKLLTYHDPLYPEEAKEYLEAPTLLYYRGTIRKNAIGAAIVGSRRCSVYGKQVAIEAAEYLASQDIPVISGMAKGIDGYAHIASIKSGGYTVAFLGHGLDLCYPKEHRELMEGIIEKGAVISEYPPNTRPLPAYFPKRNGLISSWSSKILIVEAGERSGALITAEIAKLQGKEILVAPHEIYSITGRGSNNLLLKGAKIYLHPSQLFQENVRMIEEVFTSKAGKVKPREEKKFSNLTPIQRKIMKSLNASNKTIEEIEKDSGIHQINLIEELSIMELEGMIQALPGGRFKLLAI